MNAIITEPAKEKQILISTSGKTIVAGISDIVFLKSEGCYTRIYLKNNSEHIQCKTLKTYHSILNDSRFIQCHRSYIVNSNYIKAIISKKSDYLILATGDRIPISRRKLNETKKRIELLIV